MKKIILTLSILLLTIACSKDVSNEYGSGAEQEGSADVVLQERNPNLPKVWSKKKPSMLTKSSSEIPVDQYLGRGYRIGNAIVGDDANAGFPIVNITKLRAAYPSYTSNYQVGELDMGSFSYSDYNRYETNIQTVKKIKSGFNLNLGLFSIGRKKAMTETFKNKFTSEEKTVYGESWVEVQHRKYELQTILSARKRMAADFLDETFLFALYNDRICDVLDAFGTFVLTGYYSGGRASALYNGHLKNTDEFVGRENDMDTELSASFSWKGGSSKVSGELGFGNENAKSTDYATKFSNVYFTVKTSGGAYGVITDPTDILDGHLIDLSPWVSSLNDETTHKLVGIMDNGLYPISDFMLEENFSQRVEDTHNEYLPNKPYSEPFIEIIKVYIKTVGGEKLYKIAPVLTTRQGDQIILKDGLIQETDAELRGNNDSNTFMTRANAITLDKSKYYECAIRANAVKTINPILRNPLCFDISGLDESRLCKYKNPNTDMWYLYDSVGKVAFSYYFDDYILEAYGIKTWIDKVPEKTISMTSLFQLYRIIGL